MKLRIALLAIAGVAGVLASIAVAKPPPGHGHSAVSTTGTTTTTASTTGATTTTSGHGNGHGKGQTKKAAKVLVCHKVGNGHYVLISVSAGSAPAKGKKTGDVLATNATCPGPLQGHTGTGGHTTTTTATTTTVPTTTT